MSNYIEQAKALTQQWQALASDPELSAQGKQVRRDRIARERANILPLAKSEIRWQVNQAKQELHKVNSEYAKATERFNASWDYARLRYNADSAQAAIKTARDPQELGEVYDRITESDNHAIRAWGEIAPAAILGRGWAAEEGIGSLIARITANHEQAMTSDELQAISKRSEYATRSIVELHDSLAGFIEAVQHIDPEFGHLFDGIRIERSSKLDSSYLNLVKTVKVYLD